MKVSPALHGVLAMVLVAGCADAPQPTPWPVVERAVDPDWELTIASPRSHWRAGQPIVIRTVLRYIGPGGGTEYYGSGSGPLAFELIELGGSRILQGGLEGDCAQHTMRANDPLVVGYMKPGGYSAEDPNAAFYTEFLADPLLRLPPGRWELAARAVFSMPPTCGQGRTVALRASVVVTVD
jgi:hypothetical protein